MNPMIQSFTIFLVCAIWLFSVGLRDWKRASDASASLGAIISLALSLYCASQVVTLHSHAVQQLMMMFNGGR